MSLEDSLNEACSNLSSPRATERKKSAEVLKDFLSRNAVPSLLSANTLKLSGLTWNNIFDDINNYIIKETEKFESSKNFKSVTVPLCQSLLHLCVAGSNKGKAYIKCDKLTNACLNILNDKRLTSAIGDAYLSLLYKYVFPVDYYVGCISTTTWEDLLDVTLTACLSNNSELDDFVKMRLILYIVKNSTSCCQFVIPLRDSLPRLRKYFMKISNDKKVQEFVMKTIIILIETIMPESLLTMCEFTESILPTIFKFYDHSVEQKKKSLLFKLFKITMNMHQQSQRDGYSKDKTEVWNRHMNSILEITCLEINHIQKTKKPNETIECKHFFYVAASAFYQAFSMADDVREDFGENSAKRSRLSFNKNKTFEDLLQELEYNPIPWIGIIQMYVSHFGSSLSMSDYLLVIKSSDHIIDHINMNSEAFEQLICAAVTNIHNAEYCDIYDTILALWNTCLRNAAVTNASNKAVHSIMQSILKLNILKYKIVQPLFLLYFEKGMPVNNNSFITLNVILNKFHSKCCYLDVRMKIFSWVTHGKITDVENVFIENILSRLLCTENISLKGSSNVNCERDYYKALLSPTFNVFDENIQVHTQNEQVKVYEIENFEIRCEMNSLIVQFFEEMLSLSMEKMKEKQIHLKEFSKVISIVLVYFNIILRFNLKLQDVKEMILYILLQKSIKLLYDNLTVILKSDVAIREKITVLKSVAEILATEYVALLNIEVRQHIKDDCFHAIDRIMKLESVEEDEEGYEEDLDVNMNGLKQNCIYILAYYCRKRCAYSDELLKCILHKDLYNFKMPWDIECAFKCIQILIAPHVEAPPIDLIFGLMQNMCKELFRNAKATHGLLRILSEILEELWHLGNSNMLRKNSVIMIKSYLNRCSKMLYPKHVAVLVYECVAKIIKLNDKDDIDLENSFKEALIEKMRGDTHSVRLFCCHMLKYIAKDFTETDVESLEDNLKEIFLINVSSKNEILLEDELSNRTLTVLYSLYVIATNKNSLLNIIIVTILQLQTDKALNKRLVIEMLDKMIRQITSLNIQQYMNSNIVYILYYWFNKKRKAFKDLPFHSFGFEDLKSFTEKHMKWLVPTETLWLCNGHIEQGACLKYICAHIGRSKEEIIEVCFSNIILLCLPHIVVNKYELNNERQIKLGSEGANRLFRASRQILEDEKWSNLFLENLGELLRLTAAHTRPDRAARTHDTYTFSKDVYNGVLKYFGELIDANIMEYLCETQSMILFNILFKLWSRVVGHKIFDLKIDSFHTFSNFVESIPLGFGSEALLFNFVCSSLIHAIKISNSEVEIKLFAEGLVFILRKILNHSPHDTGFLRKSLLSEILSVIAVKKDEGCRSGDSLHSFVKTDFSDYFAHSSDVVDYVDLISNSNRLDSQISKTQFVDKLKKYTLTLSNASPEIFTSMTALLKQNRRLVKSLTLELNGKGFSNDCGNSIIHQTISALCKVIKKSTNEKITILASDCLAEIGSYDLKTLVTVPPLDTSRIVTIHPKQYLAIKVLEIFSSFLLDADTNVSNNVAKAINRLLTFRDGRAALEFCDLHKKMLLSLSPSSCEEYSDYKIDSEKFESCNNIIGYWVPSRGEDHDTWITRVTMSLLDILDSSTNYINALRTVCSIKPSVCCMVLPAVVGQILECASETQSRVLGEQINHVFKYIWDVSFEESLESSDDVNMSRTSSVIDHDLKMIINSLLDIVNFVRIQSSHYSIRSGSKGECNYLKLEYLKVSWAATAADESLAAIYYGELSAAHNGGPYSGPSHASAQPVGEHLQSIFRKCYMSIGELDAIDGCGIAHLTSEVEKRRHLISTGQYTDSLLLHDIALSRSCERGLQRGAALSLHRAGMHHLALQYIKSLPEHDELNSVKYECLAYLGDWSDFVDTKELHEESKKMITNHRSVIEAMRYACLKDCLTIQTNKDFHNRLTKPLDRAKLAAARLCRNLNMENCQNVYKIVENLQLFRDIEDYFSVRCEQTSISDLMGAWSVDMLPPYNDFKHLETMISQRTLMLEHAASTYPVHVAQINALQLQYAELGLSNERIQMAQRLVAAMKQIEHSEKVILLESQISWAKGHRDIALSLLNSILAKQSEDLKWTAISLRQCGLWMAECKRENARDILNNYLEKSMNILSGGSDTETQLKVYYDIAKFADEEYKQVVNYMNSSAFEIKVKCMEDMKGTAATLKLSQQSLSRDERIALITNNAFKDLDEAEIANTRAEKDNFLKLALRYYLLSLAQCEENDLSVFRVISLWFDNPGLPLDDDGALGRLLCAVPARKFLAVLPQLAPRLTTARDPFSDHLKKLILRCATEHPHHTLPILFSLKNSDKDEALASAGAGARAGRAGARAGGGAGGGAGCERARAGGGAGGGAGCERARAGGGAGGGAGCERARAAEALVSQVGAPAAPLRAVVQQMERVCDAIISFAYYVPESKDLKPQAISRTEPISKLRHLDAVPVPTDNIPIRNDCNYSQINTLTSFDNKFELVGGINYPKKISCLSSDGKKRILLIKGKDDLRQDAVMQQVFNIVNTLLEKNPITYRSKLLIRTYKVVPMSRRSGALEWVAGTTPLGSYLLAAHARYRPQDISPAVAREKLKECHDKRKPTKHKLAVFREILEKFRPVFHHFFTEHYLTPVTWYEHRLAYTKSVAASSMVGYILGIGDRHVQNILIDITTAELIHIDFGIAFDQGKTQPTPETVPFRLTQDIVAGFGCSGVEGVFRKCCEKTLQLLRDNQETLLTILEVLLCDPLYLWIVSDKKKPNAPCGAGGASSSAGALAERALLAVGAKLRGADGRAGGVAVAGHVAGLLRAARDPTHLCQLFPGWQPYL